MDLPRPHRGMPSPGMPSLVRSGAYNVELLTGGRGAPMTARVQSWFKVRFITGFFVTVPIVVTAWVLWIFYREVDGLLSPVYEQVLGRRVPALGFLTAVAIILVI